ncbi:MAG TPA: histidine phosphatase family protein [Longimicrobiales bacterium]|nr:histidine phosphatase family protein [Longimicrobiales bacterium]
MIIIPMLVAVAVSRVVTMPPPELRGEELMAALRDGGYTIVVRHARTDREKPYTETPAYTPPLRVDQRNLSPDGEHDVRLMAEVVRRRGIPIGEVLSSPLYRCRETADAFGPYAVSMDLRTFPVNAEAARMFAMAVPPGRNRVIVTHHFFIEELVPGIRPGDIGESEAVVIRTDTAGAIVLVGRILLADWRSLAGGSAPDATPAPQAPAAAPHGAAVDWPPVTGSAIPDTRAGRLAVAYIRAFNTGDTAAMRTFIESFMVPDANRPTEVRLQGYLALWQQHGPMAVHGVSGGSDDGLTVHVRSKAGDVLLQVDAVQDTEQLRSLRFVSRAGGHR